MSETPYSPADITRFWSKVNKTDACWEWRGTLNSGGYGMLSLRGKVLRAHRVVIELTGGSLIDGLVIDHLCRNKRCVNPDHLEQVTQAVNVARAPHPGPIGQRWTKGQGTYEHSPCGSAGAYKRGCRCEQCRAWQNNRMTRYRRLKLAA